MQQVAECVGSINQHLGRVDKECCVVSNSQYSEQELNLYQSELVNSKVIDAQGNLGYAGGVNKGIEHASGDYIYVVNPDCVLTDFNIIQIMDEMDQDDKWAITGPKVIDQDGSVQPSCRRFPKPWTFLLVRSFLSVLPGATNERNRYMMEDFDRETTTDVDWVSGGAILVKSSCIETIGGMDERYFLYMEDVDWCKSCWDAGFIVRYSPLSVVVHAGQHQSIHGGIISKLTSRHVWMHLTSMGKYFVKHGLLTRVENYTQ